MTGPKEIRVSSTAVSQSIANAIVSEVITQVERDDAINVVVRAIAPMAVNTAIKGVAIARGNLAQHAIDIAVVPGFASIPDRDDPETDISVVVLRLLWLH